MSTKIRRVYVEQFGGWWSLSPGAWETLVRRCASGLGYDLDHPDANARRLARPPAAVKSYRDADGSRNWYLVTNEALLRRPLDWSAEDFKDELRSLGEASAATEGR